MNYLAHAWIALAACPEPAFVLGSMLPDFATMAGVRLADQPEPAVRRGVALHLRSDDAFHDDPRFLELVTAVTQALSARGVGRGAARAVGHIGVELLIDGELVANASLRQAYMDALNAAPGLALELIAGPRTARLDPLLRRLRDHGPPWDYARPEGVTRRLFMALHGRPRLQPRPEDAAPIEAVLHDTQPAVRACLEGLLATVTRASLDARQHALRDL